MNFFKAITLNIPEKGREKHSKTIDESFENCI